MKDVGAVARYREWLQMRAAAYEAAGVPDTDILEELEVFQDEEARMLVENQAERDRIEAARRAQEKAQRDAHEARKAEAERRFKKACAVLEPLVQKGYGPSAEILAEAGRQKVVDDDLEAALSHFRIVEFPWRTPPTWGKRDYAGFSGFQNPRSIDLTRTRKMVKEYEAKEAEKEKAAAL